MHYQVSKKKLMASRRVFTPDNTRLRVFLDGSKISDIDQLILVLLFRFGVILD